MYCLRKMRNKSQNWSGVQYPLNFTITIWIQEGYHQACLYIYWWSMVHKCQISVSLLTVNVLRDENKLGWLWASGTLETSLVECKPSTYSTSILHSGISCISSSSHVVKLMMGTMPSRTCQKSTITYEKYEIHVQGYRHLALWHPLNLIIQPCADSIKSPTVENIPAKWLLSRLPPSN